VSPTVSVASDAFSASGAFSVFGIFVTGTILTSVEFDIRISTVYCWMHLILFYVGQVETLIYVTESSRRD
jgi:hypothetical protein